MISAIVGQQQQQQHNPNLLAPNGTGTNNGNTNSLLNATNSTQSSNNFYENTMHSDTSSLHKRKSVISSQSTGSSNNEVRSEAIEYNSIVTPIRFPGSLVFYPAIAAPNTPQCSPHPDRPVPGHQHQIPKKPTKTRADSA